LSVALTVWTRTYRFRIKKFENKSLRASLIAYTEEIVRAFAPIFSKYSQADSAATEITKG